MLINEEVTGEKSPLLAYGAMHQKMVERYAPPSVLINADDRIVHYSEHAGRYLIQPGGQPTTSIFKLLSAEMAMELRSTLDTSRQKGRPVVSRPVRFNPRGESPRAVVLSVRPAMEPHWPNSRC